MKSQQAAEREEQQRIKNLVLNYDLREDDMHDGIPYGFPSGPLMQPRLERNPNTKGLKIGPDHYNHSLSRAEKSGRHAPRARRLNLSDVDWYGNATSPSNVLRRGIENNKNARTPLSKPSHLSKKPR